MASKRTALVMGMDEVQKRAKVGTKGKDAAAAQQPTRSSTRQPKPSRQLTPPLSTQEEKDQQLAAKVEEQAREIARLREQVKEKAQENKVLMAEKKKAEDARKESSESTDADTGDEEGEEACENPAAYNKKPWTDEYKALREKVDQLVADIDRRADFEQAKAEYSVVQVYGPRNGWINNPYKPNNKLMPMPPTEVLAGMGTNTRSYWLNFSPAAYVLNDSEADYRKHAKYSAKVSRGRKLKD